MNTHVAPFYHGLFCRRMAILSIAFLMDACAFGAETTSVPPPKAAAPETLAEGRNLFKSHAEEARKKYEADLQRWPNEYLGELKKLEEAFTKDGNLNSVLATQAETKRFTAEKTIGADALVSEPEGLAEVQKKYRTLCEEAEDQRDKRMEQLTKSYISWMKDLRKKLTREKKLEEAQAVDTELQRVEEGGDPLAGGGKSPEPALAEKAYFASANDLEAARTIYTEKVSQSTGQAGEDLKKWPVEYEAALKKMEETLTQEGDLKGVVAVQEETKRFKLAGALDDGAMVTEPERLAELQQKYAAARTEALGKHEERMGRLKQAYVGRLKELQKKLTMEKKLSEAINVDNEIKRIGEVNASSDSASSSGSSPSIASSRSVPMKKGLVVHYAFDKDEGGKVTDKSGNRVNGKGFDAKWTAKGKKGGAYSFSGGLQRIEVEDRPSFSLKPDEDKTFSLWWKQQGTIEHRMLFSKKEGGATGAGFVIITLPSQSAYYLIAYPRYEKHSARFLRDEWNHLAMVRRGTTWTLYQNGQACSVIETGGPSLNNVDLTAKSPLSIGGWTDRPDFGFEGLIDEFMVFNYALSSAEVEALFKSAGGTLAKTPAASTGSAGSGRQPPSARQPGASRPSTAARPKSLPKLTLSSGEGAKYTVASLYRKVAPSVVVVSVGRGSGSGFCVGRADILMSNAHVVESADRVMVTPFAYTKNELVKQDAIGASVIYVNPAEDIAILQLDKGQKGLTPIPVARKNPAAGEKVCALGSPGLGGQILTQSITEGIVSAGAREFGGQSWLQHTAAVNPGNSGGPLLNEMGEVVGMNTLKAFLEGVSFAIPAEKIREVFNR